jgi:putative aldouronate transport system substrate-binding protein
MTVATTALLFAGGQQQAADPDEPVTFSVLFPERAEHPYSDDWLVVQEILKRRNVILDVQTGPDSDYLTKKNLVFNSGDIPDFVIKNFPDQIPGFASSGVLLPVSDYWDEMPNFQKLVADWELDPDLEALELNDGKVYMLPGFKPYRQQVQQWSIRMDLLEKHDIEVPQTQEELLEALVILKQNYPDMVGMTARWGGAHLLNMFGFTYKTHAGWGSHIFYEHDNERWVYAPATDNFREMLRMLNRFMEAGVLDPEAFTQDTSQYQQKIVTGKAVASHDWVTKGMGSLNRELEAAGVEGANWQPYLPPESTMGVRAVPPADRFNVGTVIANRAASEPYFDRLLQFLDWLYYSEEGMVLTSWGVEGVTFEVVDGRRELLPHIEFWRNPEGDLHRWDLGLDAFTINMHPEWLDYQSPERIATFLQEVSAKGYIAPTQPPVVVDSATQEFIDLTLPPLNDYVNTAQLEFIYGHLDLDADWDEYISTLEGRGLRELEERVNEAMN